MAERTMEELLQAPTEGYGEAIIIPEINADYFKIKTNLLQLVHASPFHGFERDNPHTHINNFKRITSTLKFSVKVNTNSKESSSKTDERIDKLADQISTLVEIVSKKVNFSTTRITLELATRTIAVPKGIAEDVFVLVGKFTFPAEFVVVDYEVDPRDHFHEEIIVKSQLRYTTGGNLTLSPDPCPWVSPIHVVPKKRGMTVVTNENNELIPTRLVTGWRICIDYRKLNDATRKDHFPLPFMDQMLERLAGNEFYCFLDGFSGYFQIPIDPQDQEKTTFTCPYGTFAYRRMPFGLCNAPGTFQWVYDGDFP
ncbi:reverse transcriptase domain-containing protein [Tanacetum coccineum]